MALCFFSSQMHGFNFHYSYTSCQNLHLSLGLNYIPEYPLKLSLSKWELSPPTPPKICSSVLMNGPYLISLPIHFPGNLPRSLTPNNPSTVTYQPLNPVALTSSILLVLLFPLLITMLLIKVLIISCLDYYLSRLKTSFSSIPHFVFQSDLSEMLIWSARLGSVLYLSG